MLLLPASSASSTDSSRQNERLSPVVFSYHKVPGRVQTGGHAFDRAFGLRDDHAAAGCIARGFGEKAENALIVHFREAFDRRQQRQQDVLARKLAAGLEAQGGGFGCK